MSAIDRPRALKPGGYRPGPRRKVVKVHFTARPERYRYQLECGHYIGRTTYTQRHPSKMRCDYCPLKGQVLEVIRCEPQP